MIGRILSYGTPWEFPYTSVLFYAIICPLKKSIAIGYVAVGYNIFQ